MQKIEQDFDLKKFYFYYGPNHYLNKKALVFNIYIDPKGPEVEFYEPLVFEEFPGLQEIKHPSVVDLFARVLQEVLRMDIDLYVNEFSITEDTQDYVIATEYLDEYSAEDAAMLVSDWFKSMNDGTVNSFNFKKKFEVLQQEFDKSIMGGPTLYSLVEAGLKNEIPVFFMEEENQFQWGYGIKQLRGRSTTFQTDGIKDTEFTMYKDMVGEFLMMCGFPTPQGTNCFTEAEAITEAHRLGFPVVCKPVAGHKGQGVTTGIQSDAELKVAFQNIIDQAELEDINFDGALVQQQIYGHDHRILTINGKFEAALKRVPAYVEGDGQSTIEELVNEENKKLIRLDNARSPLCKIHIDKDMLEFLGLMHMSVKSVPPAGDRVYLRRVANISAGGVSINVTDEFHPKNIEMVEAIASFFKVKCLGIDILAEDISKPWTDGNFGIIEINAGPGVFMHLAPAYGGSIDIPEKIILSHFGSPENARIPIIAGNNMQQELSLQIIKELKSVKEDVFVGSLSPEGVFFNEKYFYKNPRHEQNVKIILRHPNVEIAIFNHQKEDIYDYGFFHEGADLVILDHANWAEACLLDMLLPGGAVIEVNETEITLTQNGQVSETLSYTEENKHAQIMQLAKPFLASLLTKYTL